MDGLVIVAPMVYAIFSLLPLVLGGGLRQFGDG